jgi:hypothetical protein
VAHAWYRLRRDLDIHLDGLVPFLWRLVAGTAVMTAALVAAYLLLDLGAPLGRWRLLAETAAVAAGGLVILGLTLKAIGGGEFIDLSKSFRRKKPRMPLDAPVSGRDAAGSRS